GNTWKRLLDSFFTWLSHKLTMNTVEWRMQQPFNIFYCLYDFGVDDFEQEVLRSADPRVDILYYSAKKGFHSINYFVVVHLRTKRILYITCKPGGKKDPQIALKTKTEWYDLLHSSEYGLGDRIFAELTNAGMRINTPPPERNALYKVVASVR